MEVVQETGKVEVTKTILLSKYSRDELCFP